MALLIPVAILLITLAVYARCVGFEIVFDDRVVVVENYFVQSWRYVPALFTEHVFSQVHPTVQRNYYRPAEAEASIRQALGCDPSGRGKHFALGIVLKAQGRLESALAEFQEELRYSPDMRAAQ